MFLAVPYEPVNVILAHDESSVCFRELMKLFLVTFEHLQEPVVEVFF